MSLTFHPELPPLRADDDGTVRVTYTRVLLEMVVDAFLSGAMPDDIVFRYPSLRLVDVYGVVAYYLRHQVEVDAYLDARRREGDELRREIESNRERLVSTREELLARRSDGG